MDECRRVRFGLDVMPRESVWLRVFYVKSVPVFVVVVREPVVVPVEPAAVPVFVVPGVAANCWHMGAAVAASHLPPGCCWPPELWAV